MLIAKYELKIGKCNTFYVLDFMQDISVYLGAAPIVECLEKYRPNLVITSRVADASLFLGPMV